MAINIGTKSQEVESVKYTGVGPCTIKCLNPNKTQLSALYGGRDIEKDPEYLSTEKDSTTPMLRLAFYLYNEQYDFTTPVSFFVSKRHQISKDEKSIKLINKYGECATLPVDYKTGNIPENMRWYCMDGVRPAYVGEEELVTFLKAYLNIPNKSFRKRDNTVVFIKDLTDAEFLIENWDVYFQGNVSELQQIIQSTVDYKVKVMFGVKSVDGKQYQDVYNRAFAKNAVTDYSVLYRKVLETKNNSGYPNTEFAFEPLRPYIVEATSFTDESPQSVRSYFK